jgi:carboxymethylenebutenolidase
MRSNIMQRSIHVFILALAAIGWIFSTVEPAGAQDWAKARLDKSSRHIEDVKVTHDKRDVDCTIVFPEVKEKATAVIVIHEIFGHTDWVRSVNDQLAEAGYIAMSPDLLSGMAEGGGGSAEMIKAKADVTRAIQSLPPDQITEDLNAVAEYLSKLDACNGKVVVCGFCWGGRQAFRYATNNKDLKAAFVFYGESPTAENEIAKINCPVYGFYGGNDMRINGSLPKTTELIKAANKTYDPVIYEGAGHGFMRDAEDPNPRNPAMKDANQKAHDEAWTRWKEILKKI